MRLPRRDPGAAGTCPLVLWTARGSAVDVATTHRLDLEDPMRNVNHGRGHVAVRPSIRMVSLDRCRRGGHAARSDRTTKFSNPTSSHNFDYAPVGGVRAAGRLNRNGAEIL